MMLNCPRFERPREKAIVMELKLIESRINCSDLRTGNKEMSV